MTSVIPARRRAEEFDALVERRSSDRRRRAATPTSLELVERAARRRPIVAPRPEFVADLRERLMAEAETALVPADVAALTLPGRTPARRERRLAAVVARHRRIIGADHLDGRRRPGRAARRRALPGQAGHRAGRRPACPVDEAAKGERAARQRHRPARRGRRAPGRERPPTATRAIAGHPRRPSPTRPTRRADLLLADYADTGDARRRSTELRDFTAASIDHARGARADWSRRRPATALDRRRRRARRSIDAAGRASLPDLRRHADRRRCPPVLAGRRADRRPPPPAAERRTEPAATPPQTAAATRRPADSPGCRRRRPTTAARAAVADPRLPAAAARPPAASPTPATAVDGLTERRRRRRRRRHRRRPVDAGRARRARRSSTGIGRRRRRPAHRRRSTAPLGAAGRTAQRAERAAQRKTDCRCISSE